jgi:hypothetical protein
MNRRCVLAAAVAAPVAAVTADAPLSSEDLKIIAMAATPPELMSVEWYKENRILSKEDPRVDRAHELLAQGFLVEHFDRPVLCERYYTASEAGLAALRAAGV